MDYEHIKQGELPRTWSDILGGFGCGEIKRFPRMITTSTGRTDALNAYWMYCNNMESLWKSMHASIASGTP